MMSKIDEVIGKVSIELDEMMKDDSIHLVEKARGMFAISRYCSEIAFDAFALVADQLGIFEVDDENN